MAGGFYSSVSSGLAKRTLHLNHCVGFYNVAHFDIIEIGNVQTTFETLTNFFRIVLEALQ